MLGGLGQGTSPAPSKPNCLNPRRRHKAQISSLLSCDGARAPGMRATTPAVHAATLSSVGACLTAVLLSLRNGAGTFRVCASILDCFGHGISPVLLLYRSSMQRSRAR